MDDGGASAVIALTALTGCIAKRSLLKSGQQR